jgi:hypothetical protein
MGERVATDCLKLSCASGSFTVLLNPSGVQTVYTDYGGTSRTSNCKPMDLLVFAMNVIDFYSPSGALKVQVGGS